MTDEDRIRKMFDDYVAAFRAGDANACGRFYAEDAEYVACGMAPVRGRSSIIALHEELIGAGYELSSMETDELRLSGDLAYVRQTIRAGDGTSCAMLVLRREPGGDWLVHAEAEVTL